MQCPNCLSFNEEAAVFCAQCGSSLAGRRRRGGPKLPGLLLILILGGVGAFSFWGKTQKSDNPPATPEAPPRVTRRDPLPDIDMPGPHEVRVSITTGWVECEDAWGQVLHRIPMGVSREGWVAVPRRQLLGAKSVFFRERGGLEHEVLEGIGADGTLTLWRAEGFSGEGPLLEPWDSQRVLTWTPLHGGEKRTLESPEPAAEGLFLTVAIQGGMDQPGIFTQETSLVGWTFESDDPEPVGWLWNGALGTELRRDVWQQRFYRSTFVGGREEAFAQALASRDEIPNPTPLQLLASLLQGWRRQPMLEPDDVPTRWREDQVLPVMLKVALEVRDGWPGELVRLLDDRLLLEVGSHELFILAITATQRAVGFQQAIDLALRLEADLVPATGTQRTSYIEILRRMYLDYLQIFLDEQDSGGGWLAWDGARARFPDDPEVHLRGVELALVEVNWQEAEQLIDQRVYPLGLADREKLLRAKIAELKGLEGKIVIRFRPGARLIPTTARLNRRFDQDFLIDTGASLTTIPRAMLDQLGIPITADTPRRRVQTAGGDVIAYEVTLPVIEIGGWEINDLQVLVLDLPGQVGLGLLGLNYLKHFRMDLKSNEGLLVLEPL